MLWRTRPFASQEILCDSCLCACVCVCVWGAATDPDAGDSEWRAHMAREGVFAMLVVCVCVCDTGGAMATHFLPEEVINAPAWLWLRLFPSSNDCHTAIMACKRKKATRQRQNHGRGYCSSTVGCSHFLSNCTDEIHAAGSGNGKRCERNS